MQNSESTQTIKCCHGRNKKECKTCKYKCIHDKQRHECRQCGGSSLCEHGRRRSRCKDCGGHACCDHGIRKDCILCDGSSYCIHRIKKRHCILCKGSAVCPHGTLSRYKCFACKLPCQHKDKRYACQICRNLVHAPAPAPVPAPAPAPAPAPVVFASRHDDYELKCLHGKRPSRCRECDGCDYCEHDRIRKDCRQCHRSSICKHQRPREHCGICFKYLGKSHHTIKCVHNVCKSKCPNCQKKPTIEDIVDGDGWYDFDGRGEEAQQQTGSYLIKVSKGRIISTQDGRIWCLQKYTSGFPVDSSVQQPDLCLSILPSGFFQIPEGTIVFLQDGTTICLNIPAFCAMIVLGGDLTPPFPQVSQPALQPAFQPALQLNDDLFIGDFVPHEDEDDFVFDPSWNSPLREPDNGFLD
jgi:hypothetical protein